MTLLPHQQRRRQAAQALRVASTHTSGRLSLMEPLFNLRELCKHLLLLEDHLAQPAKRCPDCIRKHLLTVEALADEAVALDPCGIYVKSGCMNAELARLWAERLMDGADPNEIACQIRAWRKQMTPMVFDPRGKAVIERVAATHRQRVAHRIKVYKGTRVVGHVESDVPAGDLVKYRGREYAVLRNVRDPDERFIRVDQPVY